MISTSQDWKDYTAESNVFQIKAVLTPVVGAALNLTGDDFMGGSVRFTDASSSGQSFNIGSVISNSFKCTLNNQDGKFDGFRFRGATIAVQFGVIYEDESAEWIDRGIYTVEMPSTLGKTIQLVAYDFMDKMNRAYIGKDGNGDIVFPIYSQALAQALCDYCGVSYDEDFWSISSNLEIDGFEYNESTTCREVLCWICQINCGFARMKNDGKMKVQWYSSGNAEVLSDALDGGIMNPWGSDETADGGIMDPWTVVPDIDGGYALDYSVSKVSAISVGSEDVEITGVRAYVPNTVDAFNFSTAGAPGYILEIKDNALVNDENKEVVANAIWQTLKGIKLRPYNATIYGDPAYEAGDLIAISDYLGRVFVSYVTNITFNLNALETISCGAETPADMENSYSNPNTSVMAGAVVNAYDYIQAKKISADYISAGTIEATVVAKDFKLEGGSISIETNDENADWINLNLNSGTGRYTSNTSPTVMGIAAEYDYYADFIGNRNVMAGLEVGRWDGQTQTQVLTADAMGNVYINGNGTAKFSGSVTASSFVNSSRIDLKENIKKVDSVLNKIKDADILSFNFIDDAKERIGLAIGGKYNVPEEVVAKDEDGEDQGVDLYTMVSMAWKAIQEQQEIIEQLETRVEVLEKKLNPFGKITDIIKGDNDGNTN